MFLIFIMIFDLFLLPLYIYITKILNPYLLIYCWKNKLEETRSCNGKKWGETLLDNSVKGGGREGAPRRKALK